MRKNYEIPFALNDFEHSHLRGCELYLLEQIISRLNYNREQYLLTGDRFYYENILELIPASYKGGLLCKR